MHFWGFILENLNLNKLAKFNNSNLACVNSPVITYIGFSTKQGLIESFFVCCIKPVLNNSERSELKFKIRENLLLIK